MKNVFELEKLTSSLSGRPTSSGVFRPRPEPRAAVLQNHKSYILFDEIEFRLFFKYKNYVFPNLIYYTTRII